MHKRISAAAMILTVAVLCLTAISACSGTKLAYEGADTLEAKAYVASNHFHALQIEANDLADAGASQSLIDKMGAAELAARPVILQLGTAAEAFTAVRSAETEEALQVALNDAAIALSDFINSMRR